MDDGIDIIAIVDGKLRVGCQVCRRVWDTTWAPTLWCACGVQTATCDAWARAGHVPRTAPLSTSAEVTPRWTSQAHRTAMVAMLILVVSLWAVPLCVLLATECPP
jgi:hypothetical protein